MHGSDSGDDVDAVEFYTAVSSEALLSRDPNMGLMSSDLSEVSEHPMAGPMHDTDSEDLELDPHHSYQHVDPVGQFQRRPNLHHSVMERFLHRAYFGDKGEQGYGESSSESSPTNQVPDVMSEEEEQILQLDFAVEAKKTWLTQEDADIERIESLAMQLR